MSVILRRANQITDEFAYVTNVLKLREFSFKWSIGVFLTDLDSV